METETMEKIMVILPQWKIGGVRDGDVYVGVDGCPPAAIPTAQFTDGALRQIKAICLGKIHNLVKERASICCDIASINEELDRRVNEKACRNNTPPVPAETHGRASVQEGIV